MTMNIEESDRVVMAVPRRVLLSVVASLTGDHRGESQRGSQCLLRAFYQPPNSRCFGVVSVLVVVVILVPVLVFVAALEESEFGVERLGADL